MLLSRVVNNTEHHHSPAAVRSLQLPSLASTLSVASYPLDERQSSKMKNFHSTIVLILAASLLATTTKAFVPSSSSVVSIPLQQQSTGSSKLWASENEEFMPETAFGAEVVPEGQRPVNEYLDMKRAPLFGWASNEVGTDGLLTRLAIIYAVVFATV